MLWLENQIHFHSIYLIFSSKLEKALKVNKKLVWLRKQFLLQVTEKTYFLIRLLDQQPLSPAIVLFMNMDTVSVNANNLLEL